MKTLMISEDIVPIGEFKVQAAKVLRQLRDSGRPIVITQNGRPAAVLITPEEFDRLTDTESLQSDNRATVRDIPVSDEELDAFARQVRRRRAAERARIDED